MTRRNTRDPAAWPRTACNGRRRQPVALAIAGALCLGTTANALAEEADDAASEAAVTLDTLTVTARRAAELAKDIPFSISTVSGEQLEERRLRSLSQMLQQTPSVDFVSNMGMSNRTLRIRGVGSLQKVSGEDTSVVINLDGLPLSATSSTMNLLDVERVEVLKGPQGTLFGRNSEAGAVNITTRRPTRWTEGYVRGEVGEDNYWMLEAAVGGPVTETLSARIAARTSRIDSFVTNEVDGDPVVEPTDQAVRGSLLWEPVVGTSLLLTAGHEEQKDSDVDYVLYPYSDSPRVNQPSGSLSDSHRMNRFTAELNHELKHAVLTLLSGYSESDNKNTTPIYEGRTYQQLVGTQPDARWSTVSDETVYNNEIRLSSKPGSELFWVTGVNYYYSDRTWDSRDNYDNFYPYNPYNARIDRDFTTEALAVFGETTMPIPNMERLKLTLGARYTWEEKDYEADWVANPSNPSSIRTAHDEQSLSDDYLTGRIALGYALTEEINLYGLFARGYKSGGFNQEGTNFTAGGEDPPYKAATVNSLETGFKFESADGRFGLNGALFYNKVKDDHLLSFDPQSMSTLVENYDTESKGVELEGVWRVGNGLTLSGAVTYLDAHILVDGDDSASPVKDDNEVPEVPNWGASVSINYIRSLPAFLGLDSPTLSTELTNRYVGSRPANPENHFELDAYNKLDLRIGLQEKGVEFYVWGENLLDEDYDLYGYHIAPYYPGGNSARIGYPGRPRSFGVGLSYVF
ncbi:TonB-dependent receptor [Marichromatium bheemlicum]|uniref:TonB-dependent receptor n=1 Tax=Marichromatium bheemlicum TaxID=365339 RepID=A0ABX1I9D6_9GAMM|nr:TonB-dependent receptor [Marichromatium bheemlicum]NKN34164.1 TonB-dependent receptor [Marichromatium bheemlicum]